MTTPTHNIKKVAVIGAGVMGAGIAAQVANAGLDVVLLDIVPKDAADRSVIAKGAIEKLKKASPAPLMHPSYANRITPGNTEDDLALLSDCDWIIEAVLEDLKVKQTLYKNLSKHRKKGAVVSSNTSTLPIAQLMEGFPAEFRNHFMITHFFNPPRYMRLLEIVAGPDTDPQVVMRMRAFGDIVLGKDVVDCNDTPGFIANRIGSYWLYIAVTRAIDLGLTVEEVDAINGRPMGIPKTGLFGLMDLVGLDLMHHVLDSMRHALPQTDPFNNLPDTPKLIDDLIAEGYTGRKGKGGFYRLNPDNKEAKEKQVVSLKDGTYGPVKRPKPAAVKAAKKGGMRALLTHPSPQGRYAWEVFSHILTYAASLVPEITDTPEAVDRAMRLGYNWKYGPFEMMDKLGTGWFTEQLKKHNRDIPDLLAKAAGRPFYRTHQGKLECLGVDGTYQEVVRPAGMLLLDDIKRRSKPVMHNISASVWDIGDGVLCFEVHSKMNSLDPFVMHLLKKTLRHIPRHNLKGLVLHNEGSNFSVGANLAMLMITAKLHLWPVIRWILWQGQMAYKQMKYANFPVVAGPSGMALGGGCEMVLHCDAAEAHAETYMGLVEAGVGIVPGWGGCKEMLTRHWLNPKRPKGPMPPVMKAFETIVTAQVAKSAAEAKDLLFLRPDDGIVMNRDRVLAAAKARVLAMAEGYTPPVETVMNLPGLSGRAALMLGVRDFVSKGMASRHDARIASELAAVLTGGDTDVTAEVTENRLLRLERDALIKLAHTPESKARAIHMLTKGKPLRN